MTVIILSYKFGQTWEALTLQDSWNDLQLLLLVNWLELLYFIKKLEL